MKKDHAKPLAYSYIRMSTDVQLKGNSLERQKEKSREYADENNLELVENFHDIGISAFSGQNVEQGMFGQFLQLVKDGTIPKGSYLLIESLDRLSRQNIMESIPLFIGLLKADITIVTLIDGQIYGADKADFQNLLYPMVVLSRAHEESVAKSYRISKAWASKRLKILEKKLTAICPAWLKLNYVTNQFDIIADRGVVVRSIFDMADKGYGSYSISKNLNNNNIPTFGSSKGWHDSYITRILNNRAVLGEFQAHKLLNGVYKSEGEVVADYFPNLIDEEQFLRVRQARRKRAVDGAGRKGPAYRNLFTNIAKCAYCGAPMRFVHKGPPPKGGMFLRCTNSVRNFSCTASSWRYSQFETAFLYFVQELDLAETLKNAEQQNERSDIEGRLAVIDEKIIEQKCRLEKTYDLIDSVSSTTEFLSRKLDDISKIIFNLELEKEDTLQKISKLKEIEHLDDAQIKNFISQIQDKENYQIETKRRAVASRLKSIIKSLTLATDGLGNEKYTISSFENFDPLFNFLETNTIELSNVEKFMTFSVVLIDGLMRRVTVSRDNPLDFVQTTVIDKHGLIIESDLNKKYERRPT